MSPRLRGIHLSFAVSRPCSLLGLVLFFFCLGSCRLTGTDDFLQAGPASQLQQYGRTEYGAADISMRMDVRPGEEIAVPADIRFGIQEGGSLRVEVPVVAFDDGRGENWEIRTTGDLVLGYTQQLRGIQRAREGKDHGPALAIHAFAVSPKGAAARARVPGLVEGEEGYFGLLSAEWLLRGPFGRECNLLANVGGGLARHKGRAVRTGRGILGLAGTIELGRPGYGISTEAMTLRTETFWVLDPPAGREFGELGVGLALPVSAFRWELGVRFGLGDDSDAVIYYLALSSKLFDALL